MKGAVIGAVVFGILILGIGGMSSCAGRKTGEGEKVGSVIKYGEYGFWNRTWEGELIHGGMSNGSGGFSTTPLHFTVAGPHLAEKVQAALDGQYEVKVRYEVYQWRPWDSDNGGTFLVAIEPLKKADPPNTTEKPSKKIPTSTND